jgi:hypothetical protein
MYWFDRHLNWLQIAETNFAAINNFPRLIITASVYPWGTEKACTVQDALFHIFNSLRNAKQNKLKRLTYRIEISNPRVDGSAGYNFSREFRSTEPGEISRGHLTAFLLDPVRTIRLSLSMQKVGAFQVLFRGHKIPPWNSLIERVVGEVHSDRPVRNYLLFMPYFTARRRVVQIITKLRTLADMKNPIRFEYREDRFPDLPIWGDASKFHTVHKKQRRAYKRMIEGGYRWGARHPLSRKRFGFVNEDKRPPTQAEQEEVESLVREGEYLLEVMDTVVPTASADTSQFSYALLDRALERRQAKGLIDDKPRQCQDCSKWDCSDDEHSDEYEYSADEYSEDDDTTSDEEGTDSEEDGSDSEEDESDSEEDEYESEEEDDYEKSDNES